MVCGGNGGQNFFQKHTGGDLWRLKILECTMACGDMLKEWKKPLELFQEKDIVRICAPMVRYSKLVLRL